jgi:hypothetical protein
MHRRHANRRTPRQNDRTNRFNPNSLSQPPRPNPHSARGTAVTCSTAISCLGAFRTPAASVRDSLINAGVRKPAHKPTFSNPFISCLWRAERGREELTEPGEARPRAPTMRRTVLPLGPAWGLAARFIRHTYIAMRIAAAAWFQPSPELIMTTRSPRLILPSSMASSNAMGMHADPV